MRCRSPQLAAVRVASESRSPNSELGTSGPFDTHHSTFDIPPRFAVHGLEGEIKHGGNNNSHYDGPHDATGRFDFVLANPPFNVNAVDTAMRVSAGRRLDVNQILAGGLPRKCPTGSGRIETKN